MGMAVGAVASLGFGAVQRAFRSKDSRGDASDFDPLAAKGDIPVGDLDELGSALADGLGCIPSTGEALGVFWSDAREAGS